MKKKKKQKKGSIEELPNLADILDPQNISKTKARSAKARLERKLEIKKRYKKFTTINDLLVLKGVKIKTEKGKINKKIFVKEELLLAEIPLMTEEGTFVISGYERIVISQIIRSPGLYFRKEYGTLRKIYYTATIISNKGLWTKFILDVPPPPTKEEKKQQEKEEKQEKQENEENENEIENENKKRKDRVYIKLNEFKIKNPDYPEEDKENDENRLFLIDILRYFGLTFEEILDTTKYRGLVLRQQIRRFSSHINLTDLQFDNLDEEIMYSIQKLFLNSRANSFSLGEIGRYKLNKKLGINLPKETTYLTAHDLIGILDGLMELKYCERISDDIDEMKNKQIRCVGDLLQNQLRVGLFRLQKNIIDEDELKMSSAPKVNLDLEAYTDSESWIIDPRPVTSVIKEFFKTSQLSQFMDQTNPLAEMTHKRKISVFGPNGLKRDHISTVIRDIHPTQYGRLCPVETPEGQSAGLIASMAMFGRLGSIGSIETPYFFMENGRIFSEKNPIYLNPEEESKTRIAFSDISLTSDKKIKEEYLSSKENSIFGLKRKEKINFMTTSPFQLVSLATALIPFVEHNDANRALMGSNMQRQAVPLLYTQKPIIGTGLEMAAILDSGMIIKSYCQGKVTYSSSSFIKIKDLSNQNIQYLLRKYFRSNQETSINQRPIVWTGENVFSGQIIADGPGTNDGELALGRNLLLAYMPWEGYNYEDAIVINERVLIEDCLTSVHIEEHETNLSLLISGREKLTQHLKHLTNYVCRHLDKSGIVKIGSYVKEHDILVGKLTPCDEDTTPEGKLIRAIFGNKEKQFRDTSLRVPHGTEGRVVDIRKVETFLMDKEESSLFGTSKLIRIYIAQIRKLRVGDKLSGRHGNKGIISRVLSRQDMPYLPDGTPIDILFNPLGVPSRMNVGQVFECLLGLAGDQLGYRYKISPFDEIYGKEASRVLVNQKLKQASFETKKPWLFYSGYPGKMLLRDGRTGEYFDNPITVGKSYILKLIHLVEDKIHARATGPYSMITEQPLAGKAQKGGQRFGEMEVWALEGYGCSNTLQELLTIKSDDMDGRNDIYESILVRKETEKPKPSIPEAFLALMRELNALGLDFCMQKIEGGFYSTSQVKSLEKDIFTELEDRLKLRTFISRKKNEELAKLSTQKEKKQIKIINNSFDNEEDKDLQEFKEPQDLQERSKENQNLVSFSSNEESKKNSNLFFPSDSSKKTKKKQKKSKGFVENFTLEESTSALDRLDLQEDLLEDLGEKKAKKKIK